jgi:hypothetical protein
VGWQDHSDCSLATARQPLGVPLLITAGIVRFYSSIVLTDPCTVGRIGEAGKGLSERPGAGRVANHGRDTLRSKPGWRWTCDLTGSAKGRVAGVARAVSVFTPFAAAVDAGGSSTKEGDSTAACARCDPQVGQNACSAFIG